MVNKLIVQFLVVILILFFRTPVHAQQDIGGFLSSSITDIRVLIENYAAPFIKGEGYAVANGWYNTGKAHKPFGFDFTITINSSMLPAQDRFFTFVPSHYQFISLGPGLEDQIPTAIAADRPGPILQSRFGDVSFNTPAGLGLPQWQGKTLAFMPIAQVGVGLFSKTDLKFRYWPEIKIGKSTNNAVGIALMHEVGQWIPLFERLKLNGSLLAGYTRLKSSYDFSPDNPGIYMQQSIFMIRSYTTQFILSKDFSILTILVGGGYNFIDSEMAYEGSFELKGPGGELFQATLDPISILMNYSAPQITFGTTLKLAILKLHAAYTLTAYPVGTIGASLEIN